jgi:serine/threonine protein kinase/Flp pilus assembly protein TadD
MRAASGNSSGTNRLLQRLRGDAPQALTELFGRHRERLRKMVRLRLDRRLRDRFHSSAVLDDVQREAARRIGDYQADPALPFFLWLRLLAGQRIQALHRQHLGEVWDAGHELSLYRGALPRVDSVSLAAQLLGDRPASQAAARAELLLRLQGALNGMDATDREVLALCHFEELQESLGRRVALKILPAQALLDPRHHKRFQREAKAAARLHHTNIVPVYGVGEHEGIHYYVMQFIPGLGLDKVLGELKRLQKAREPQPSTVTAAPAPDEPAPDLSAADVARSLLTGQFATGPFLPGSSQEANGRPNSGTEMAHEEPAPPARPAAALPGPLTPSSEFSLSGPTRLSESGRHYWLSAARIGIQVAAALDYAAGQGILHRDVKPSNLLLDMQGNVWVTDFGLAKASADGDNLTHTGDIVGTLRYMAPERFEGHSDIRCDIYSLGLTLYELVVQRPAFAESDRSKLIHLVTQHAPPPPRKVNAAVPRDLETIVLKAIARDPAHRYQTAAALADDLQRFVEDKPIRARRVSLRERCWRWCRRNPALAAATGLAAAALVVATVVSSLFAVAQGRFAAEQTRYNEELLREQEETRAEKERAEAEAARAEKALQELQKNSALMALQRAESLLEQGQLANGLLWLMRGLQLAPAPEVNLQQTIRTNLASLRGELPFLKTTLPSTGLTYVTAISPDGRRLATGSAARDKSAARLWTATGAPVGAPLEHAASVYALAFSPDGKTLLTGSPDRTAKAAAFSPDGRGVVTAGNDNTARLWDAATGRPLCPPLRHQGSVHAVAFNADGSLLATAGYDRTVRFWNARTGQPVGVPLRHPTRVLAVAFRADGDTLLTIGEDRLCRSWQAPSALAGDAEQLSRAAEAITGLTLSPEGAVGGLNAAEREKRLHDLAASGNPFAPPTNLGLSWHQHEALACLDAANGSSARWHLDRQLHDQPNDWLAHVWRTRAHTQLNEFDQAAGDMAKALELAPDAAYSWYRLYQSDHADKQQWRPALWYLDRLIAARPKEDALYVERGQVHGKQNHWKEAAADYAKAAELQPREPNCCLECGRAHLKLGQWDEAAARFAKALELLPVNFAPNSRRSRAITELIEQEKALAKLIELRPKDGHLHFNRALRHERRKEWDRADVAYGRAAELAPDNATVFFSRGDYYGRRQLWEKAAADFERGLQLDPSDHRHWYHGATLRLQVGDRAGYRRYCREMLRRFGHAAQPEIIERTAKICLLAPEGIGDLPDDLPRPQQLARQVVTGTEQNGYYPYFQLAMGIAEYRAGRFAQSVEWLTKTRQTFLRNSPLYQTLVELFLAMSYQRLGRGGEARQTLEHASKVLDGQLEKWKQNEVDPAWLDWLMCLLVRPEAALIVKN